MKRTATIALAAMALSTVGCNLSPPQSVFVVWSEPFAIYVADGPLPAALPQVRRTVPADDKTGLFDQVFGFGYCDEVLDAAAKWAGPCAEFGIFAISMEELVVLESLAKTRDESILQGLVNLPRCISMFEHKPMLWVVAPASQVQPIRARLLALGLSEVPVDTREDARGSNRQEPAESGVKSAPSVHMH